MWILNINLFNFRKFILFYKSEECESIVSGSQIDIRFFRNRGFRPLHPDLLFVLKQKVSKKFKTTPASLEKLILLILLALGRVQVNLTLHSLIAKLAFDRLNRPNSPQLFLNTKHWYRLKQGRFSTPLSLIFRLTGRGRPLANLSATGQM